MAITTKLELRQSHSLVMTPQLQQAIKLLQLSNMELASFVEAELERNPLLERADAEETGGPAPEPAAEPRTASAKEEADGEAAKRLRRAGRGRARATTANGSISKPAAAAARISMPSRKTCSPMPKASLPARSRTPAGPRSAKARAPASMKSPISKPMWPRSGRCRDHLTEQLMLAFADPAQPPDRPSPHRHDRRGRLSARRSGRASPSCSARRSSWSRRRSR